MPSSVKNTPPHQCLLHDGASPHRLWAVATVMRAKLQQNYRCIYFDSPSMLAQLRPFLEAAGIQIEREVIEKRLLLSAEQQHLAGDHFDPDRMMRMVEANLQQALDDGFDGLWGSGDVAWEMGPRVDFCALLEYERKLENFIRQNPEVGGICQYHAGMLSREAVRHSLLTHQSIFVSENLSMVNPYFLECGSSIDCAAHPVLLDAAIGRLCEM